MLAKSNASKTGYFNVVEVRPGQFYPKKKMDEVAGSKKQKTFGKAQPTAKEAAKVLARWKEKPYELPSKPRLTEQQKKLKELDKLSARAHVLLGMNPMSEEELARVSVEAENFAAWSEACRAGAPVVVPDRAVVPVAPPVPRGEMVRCWIGGEEVTAHVVVDG